MQHATSFPNRSIQLFHDTLALAQQYGLLEIIRQRISNQRPPLEEVLSMLEDTSLVDTKDDKLELLWLVGFVLSSLPADTWQTESVRAFRQRNQPLLRQYSQTLRQQMQSLTGSDEFSQRLEALVQACEQLVQQLDSHEQLTLVAKAIDTQLELLRKVDDALVAARIDSLLAPLHEFSEDGLRRFEQSQVLYQRLTILAKTCSREAEGSESQQALQVAYQELTSLLQPNSEGLSAHIERVQSSLQLVNGALGAANQAQKAEAMARLGAWCSYAARAISMSLDWGMQGSKLGLALSGMTAAIRIMGIGGPIQELLQKHVLRLGSQQAQWQQQLQARLLVLKELATTIATHFDKRFDRFETLLGEHHAQMHGRFNQLEARLSVCQQQLQSLTTQLQGLQQRLDVIGSEASLQRFRHAKRKVFEFGVFTPSRLATFYQMAMEEARSETLAKRQLPNQLTDWSEALTSQPIEIQLNALASFARPFGVKTALPLVNPRIWAEASLVLAECIYRYPQAQLTQVQWAKISQAGQEVLDFIQTISQNQTLFSHLIEGYRRQLKDFTNLIESRLWQYQADKEKLIASIQAYLLTQAPASTEVLNLIPQLQVSYQAKPIRQTSFTGHNNTVYSVAISPDGRQLVSGSKDSTIKIWDIATGCCIRTLTGHTAGVFAVAISPDGKLLASGSWWSNTIKVWEIASGTCLRTFSGHSILLSAVNSVAITPNGQQIVSGGMDRTIRVWDINTGNCLHTLNGHTGQVNSVVITPDSQQIISGSNDSTIKVWNINSGTCVRTLSGHTDWIRSVTITPDGQQIISGSDDNSIKVWDINTGSCLRTLSGHTGLISSVAITPNGEQIISSSYDKTIKVWDIDNGSCLQTLGENSAWIHSVAISPNGQQIISSSDDKSIRLTQFPMEYQLTTSQLRQLSAYEAQQTQNLRQQAEQIVQEKPLDILEDYFTRGIESAYREQLAQRIQQLFISDADIKVALAKLDGYQQLIQTYINLAFQPEIQEGSSLACAMTQDLVSSAEIVSYDKSTLYPWLRHQVERAGRALEAAVRQAIQEPHTARYPLVELVLQALSRAIALQYSIPNTGPLALQTASVSPDFTKAITAVIQQGYQFSLHRVKPTMLLIKLTASKPGESMILSFNRLQQLRAELSQALVHAELKSVQLQTHDEGLMVVTVSAEALNQVGELLNAASQNYLQPKAPIPWVLFGQRKSTIESGGVVPEPLQEQVYCAIQ